MDKLLVHGKRSLKGSINISGSKNASLPILAATLLSDDASIVRRVPDVSDTNYMLQILRALGAEVERSSGTVRVEPGAILPEAPYDLVRKMRASICVMGPIMARVGHAKISLPGGCVIGDRPVDLHLKAMQGLGAEVVMEGGDIILSAPKGLIGAEIDMRGKYGPTVLGTDNLMMAAVLAKGTTVIHSAASEPEVVDLANFLISMGARIEGAGTRRIIIEGVDELKGVEHTVIPDRIEAGTFMAAAAMVGEGVTLKRVRKEHLEAASGTLLECGHSVEFTARL
jgi:UDP-N-acetylglucosamine 1-carboxyvinyltransferase